MFVDIDDFKSAIAVENMLMPYKKGLLSSDKKSRLPKEPITPEVCMQVLQSTNYARNIKDMLLCIAELPETEQARFKDVVLACFDNREQPQVVIDLGDMLAKNSGYAQELEEAKQMKEGIFYASQSQLVKSLIVKEKRYSNVDLSGYDKLICLNGNLDKICSEVKFPKIIEFPKIMDVSLMHLNFENVQNFVFEDGATVKFDYSSNLPKNLDVSMCSQVRFCYCNLKECTSLSFKDGADVRFSFASGLPRNLDVSKCSGVSFYQCDLKELSSVCFRDGAEVNLQKARNLPPQTDFSTCSVLMLNSCNLKDQTELRFKDGAEVYLQKAHNLPKQIDFSMCKDGEVWLKNCDFTGVERLVFKNRTQFRESSAYIPDDWQGGIIFADEQPQADLTNMAFMANAQGGR